MIGWRGGRVRNPAFGDQPSRAKSIQPFMPIRCNSVIGLGGHWFDVQVASAAARAPVLLCRPIPATTPHVHASSAASEGAPGATFCRNAVAGSY
jgi:hypothetical protein